MAFVTQHEFNVRSEQIKGEIRWTKLQGLAQDLRAEQGKTEQKRVRADIEWQKVETVRVQYQIAQEETAQARHELTAARTETQIAQVEAAKSGDRLLFANLERQATRQLMAEKLYELDLAIGEATALNRHKSIELSQALGNLPAGNYRGALQGRL